MAQIVEESKSLMRIKDKYQADAGDCNECTDFWKDMVEDKEKHLEELNSMLKNHMA